MQSRKVRSSGSDAQREITARVSSRGPAKAGRASKTSGRIRAGLGIGHQMLQFHFPFVTPPKPAISKQFLDKLRGPGSAVRNARGPSMARLNRGHAMYTIVAASQNGGS